MKKLVLCLLVLFASVSAYAGSSACTSTNSVSWSQADPYYTLQSSDCIVTVSQSDQGYTALMSYLPESPADGDEFTIKDGTDYALDNCGSYLDDPEWGGDGNTYGYCMPAGYGFQAQGNALIDDGGGYPAQGYFDSEFYYTSCTNPSNEACTAEQLPSWWADYQRKRYQMKVVFSSASGNWNLTRSTQ